MAGRSLGNVVERYFVAGSAAAKTRIDHDAEAAPAVARIVCRPGVTDAGMTT
jgi:hypothetical protein